MGISWNDRGSVLHHWKGGCVMLEYIMSDKGFVTVILLVAIAIIFDKFYN